MLLLILMLFRLVAPDAANACTEQVSSFCEDVSVAEDWQCIQNNNGIALYERWVNVDNTLRVRERRGEMVVNGHLDAVEKYLSRPQTMPEWMTSIRRIDRLTTTGTSSQVYMILGLPWPFKNRDLVGQFSVSRPDDRHSVIRMVNCASTIPVSEGCTRMGSYEVRWTLTRIDDTRTRIELFTFSGEPPLFPLCVQDPVVRKVFINNLRRLKEKLE